MIFYLTKKFNYWKNIQMRIWLQTRQGECTPTLFSQFETKIAHLKIVLCDF